MASSAGWYWPFRGAILVTERPSFLSRDERNRLHCEDGMAIRYPDGWGLYRWHGVNVPERVILTPDQLTVEEALAERNAEVRRVMLERVGAEKLVARTEVVNSDPVGKLLQLRLDDGEVMRFAHVACSSTGRQYAIPVPPDMPSCRAGIAWTFQLQEHEYRPAVET